MKEINILLSELENYPLYIEYDNIQKNLNIDLQVIKNSIENTINKITN